MRILITGNMGYIGPILGAHLRRVFPGAYLIGVDSGWFAHCLTTNGTLPELALDEQRFGDVRALKAEDFAGVDAVVQLAAVSNDPMGNRFEAVTDAINHRASVRVAEQAAKAGVRNYVFASSCSIYGYAADPRARNETDPVNPLTAYARSKIATEQSLEAAAFPNMVVTCLRFATACGMSPRLRLDLVLNDFVAGAMSSGQITVLSDGTPWRPLIHVKDMSRAIEWAIQRKAEPSGRFLKLNVGSDAWNYQVSDLAQAVGKSIAGTRVSINTDAPPDKRSYKVDFGLYRKLAPDHQPLETLETAVAGLRDGLGALGFADKDFRTSQLMRLKVLERHLDSGNLKEDLSWAANAPAGGKARAI
ncbi:MAG: NAD-dependent epimerase/dehydratase family protein [Panacagrimonas sp.]